MSSGSGLGFVGADFAPDKGSSQWYGATSHLFPTVSMDLDFDWPMLVLLPSAEVEARVGGSANSGVPHGEWPEGFLSLRGTEARH